MFSSRLRLALVCLSANISIKAVAFSGKHDQQKKTLLETGSKHRSKSRWGNPMLNAEYFGLFSQGESTNTYDGSLAGRKVDPEMDVLDGWNPHYQDPFQPEAVRPYFFHESPSGAYLQAWQSHYPALSGKSANDGSSIASSYFPSLVATLSSGTAETGEWFQGSGGYWQQDYVNPSIQVPGPDAPSWFDDSVRQVDGLGRQKFPGIGSPRNYVLWQQRSVNTTLTCSEPGCIANVSLAAPLDLKSEEAAECLISVFFHPTALDQTDRDFVEWVEVNNQPVQAGCRPVAAGCNSTAQLPLLPCVYNVPLQKLWQESGVFTVAAKIRKFNSSMSCPYDGNHLSAVPMLTCLVGNKYVPIELPQGAPMLTEVEKSAASAKHPQNTNMLKRILQAEAHRDTLKMHATSSEQGKHARGLLGRSRHIKDERSEGR